MDRGKPVNGFFEISPLSEFRACSYTTIMMTYTVGRHVLTKGSRVKIALPNNGWEEPKTPYSRGCPELYKGEDRLFARWSKCNTTVRVESNNDDVQLNFYYRNSQNIIGKYDNWSWWLTIVVEEGTLIEGDKLIVIYGDTSLGEKGALVQSWVERGRNYFSAFVDLKRNGELVEVDGSPIECTVVPGEVDRCAITIPSIIRPDISHRLKLTLTDRGHNPVSDISISEVHLRDDKGKEIPARHLFQNSCCDYVGELKSKNNIRYTIQAICKDDKAVSGRSNPSLCRPDGPNLYWGDLHCHSFYHMYNPELGQGHPCTSPVELIHYARDVSHLDFVALTDGRGALPDNAGWEESQRAVIDNYKEGKFVTLKGWEIQFGNDGHRNAIYRNAELEPHIEDQAFRKASVWDKAGSSGMSGALKYYHGRKDVMLIPHHTMAWMNWEVLNPELDRLVEIYSCWGSSEHRHNELWSKASPEKRSVRYALSLGYKLGFVGGSDSHTGYVGRSIPDSDRYKFVSFKSGLTAVWAESLTRQGLFDALYNRQCYATTGERIIVEFFVDGHRMGKVVTGVKKLDSHVIKFMILGTDIIKKVEVIRNGEVSYCYSPGVASFSGEWVDSSDQAKKDNYYYLKVIQTDGNTAWTSPVWV